MNRKTLLILAALPLLLCASRPAQEGAAPPFGAWAEETLTAIEEQYHLPETGLYAASPGGSKPDHAWAMGVQLSALAAAARMDAKHRPALERLISAMEAYWRTDGEGLAGYDATAFTAKLDRYYDDNAWIALALIEAYEATGDRRHLDRARETIGFILTGEDQELGGGIWWHEQTRASKNTCAAAPAIVALLRMNHHEPDPSLRAAAVRLYEWTARRLRDPNDGLLWDSIDREGRIDRRKFTYNTALMIRAALLLAASAGEADATRLTQEALRMARAAEAKWIDRETGAIRDGGRFAHLLAEAFVEMTEATGDRRWRDLAERAAVHVRERTRGPNGSYSDGWDRPPADGERAELIAQASAARIFARLARPPLPAHGGERGQAHPR